MVEICWSRWVTLSAGIYLMLCAGPIFAFGAISDDVRKLLGATEWQQQLIATAGNVGLWTNVVGGLVFDRFGARPTLTAGAMMAVAGYIGFYLALIHRWHPLVAAVAWATVGHGSGWIYISTLFSNVKNFTPADRGFVVGTMSTFFGVSATIMVAILGGCIGGSITSHGDCEGGFLGGSVIDYIKFLGVFVGGISILGICLTRVQERSATAPDDFVHFRFNLLLAGVLILVAFICGVNVSALTFDPWIKTYANYVLFALLLAFLALPIHFAGEDEESEDATDDCDGESSISEQAFVCAPEGLTPGEVVRTRRFWALWLVFGATVGGYIMTLNNLGSMATSRSLDTLAGRLGIIFATGSDTFSRFLSGFVVGKGVPLTMLLGCGPLLMCASQVIFVFSTESAWFYVACIILGLADGIMWTLGPLFTGKAFGLRASGKNFGLVVLAAACFALLLMLGLEPAVYHAHLRPGETVCYGVGCFQLTHAFVCMLSLVVSVVAALLHLWQRDAELSTHAN